MPKNRSVLMCRYRHYDNPRLFIQPAKEEVVFDHPRLIIFHDILNDAEIKKVKSLAAPRVSHRYTACGQSIGGARLNCCRGCQLFKKVWTGEMGAPVLLKYKILKTQTIFALVFNEEM